WAIPLLVFCGVSALTAEKLFAPRYLIQSDVGLALLAGLGIGCLRPAVARSMVTVSIMIWALGRFRSANPGTTSPGWRWVLWPIHGNEDWRSAMAAVRQRAGPTQMPVILQSGFVESSTMNLGGAGQLSSYLMAPLSIYPGAGKI